MLGIAPKELSSGKWFASFVTLCLSYVVQVAYGWSILDPDATIEINIQPILHCWQLRSQGLVWVWSEKKAPLPVLHKGSSKGWGFSKFLPKHTASFICHSNPIYFYQICLAQLTTQCVCFCRLYREKSLILTLENRFILQRLLYLSLALTISPTFIPMVLEMGARVSSRLSMCSMMKVPPQAWNASPVPHVLFARLLNTCSFGWAYALRLWSVSSVCFGWPESRMQCAACCSSSKLQSMGL